jgi:peptidoglycan/LPS O-acetylase OafA/YrhL
MTQISLQPSAKSPEQAPTGKAARLYFIDYLRAALVILVVLHHLAVVYGGIPAFYYWEPPVDDPLAVFVLFNQAWFMGALFLLAGYFTPGSFDRKRSASFLKDRLRRLGIPLVVFYFVLNPISAIGFFFMPASLTGITDPLSWQVYPYLVGLGPMWFVAMLLVFSFGYAGWRRLTRDRPSASLSNAPLPSYRAIGLLILALALASYLVRIIIPLGEFVLQFPSLSYLPQYLSFFVVGTVASRRNWFQTVPSAMGKAGLVIALVATVVLFPIVFISLLSAVENGAPQLPPFGYGTWQSAVYAFWDSAFAVGICLAAITFFRRFFNGASRFGSFLSQQSYTAYIIHSPIIVFLAVTLRGVELEAILKFGLATVIVVPTCFALAYVVRKIPGASTIL